MKGIRQSNWISIGRSVVQKSIKVKMALVEVFRIIPEFRILRLTFYEKSQKVSLKMLNFEDSYSFADFLLV